VLTSKLNIQIVQYTNGQECDYCFQRFPSAHKFRIIVTSNENILNFFGRNRTKHSQQGIRLCQSCFEKLHSTLEEMESEGWTVLEEMD
jgi:hypothetical protein